MVINIYKIVLVYFLILIKVNPFTILFPVDKKTNIITVLNLKGFYFCVHNLFFYWIISKIALKSKLSVKSNFKKL